MAALASSSTTTTNLLPQREDAPPFVVVSLISEDGVDLNAELLAVEREMRVEAEEEANADAKDERFGDGEAKEEGEISDDEEEEEDEEEDKMRRPKLPSVGSRGQVICLSGWNLSYVSLHLLRNVDEDEFLTLMVSEFM